MKSYLAKLANDVVTQPPKAQKGLIISIPLVIDGWEDGVKKWPCIMCGSIFSCFLDFVDSLACNGKAMSNLKKSEAYQYLNSNKVSWVLFKDAGNNLVYLKADIKPSQSLHVSHLKAWVLTSKAGVIQTVGCSCIAGPGRSCSHAAAILWKVRKVAPKNDMKSVILL